MKKHKIDGGQLVQIDMKFYGMHPCAVYKCQLCGKVIDDRNPQEIE